jgi:hypothetical protein
MQNQSIQFLTSPRFFALPLIALTIIVALASSNARSTPSSMEVAAPVVRAVSCSAPARSADPACTVARTGNIVVR